MNLVLEINNIRKELTEIINQSIQNGVPCSILEIIIKDVHEQISNLSRQELQMAQQQEETKDEGSGD